MNNIFQNKFALITRDNADPAVIDGIMRKDNSAAILQPSEESLIALKNAYKLRYFKSNIETHDYIIREYYCDEQRPISKQLIKPIVVCLSLLNNN